MVRTFFLSVALFTAFIACDQPQPTMKTDLDICGSSNIRNPTETDIRQAVFALDTKINDAFLILSRTEMTYIQTTGDQNVGFTLEYQEDDLQHHYRAKRSLTADEIVKAFALYSTGSDEWKNMAEWEQMQL